MFLNDDKGRDLIHRKGLHGATKDDRFGAHTAVYLLWEPFSVQSPKAEAPSVVL